MSLDPEEIAALVAPHLEPREPGAQSSILGAGSDDIESGRAWLAAADGLAVPTWPRAWGGRDADESEAALIADVLERFAVPDLYPYAVGLDLVGPILMESGRADQQSRWLPRIADGSEIWCQMFSEPDAGSDMANIATRAQRDGDEWVISGQ